MRIFKILTAEDWAAMSADGCFPGSPADRTDGFIHFSTAGQLAETLARHFAGCGALILLACDTDRMDERKLCWEPARGGALFPHLYDTLPMAAVITHWTIPPDGAGGHRLPAELADG